MAFYNFATLQDIIFSNKYSKELEFLNIFCGQKCITKDNIPVLPKRNSPSCHYLSQCTCTWLRLYLSLFHVQSMNRHSLNNGNTTDYSRSGWRLCDNIVSGLVSDSGGISSHSGEKNVKYCNRPAYLDTDAKMPFICWWVLVNQGNVPYLNIKTAH